MGVDINIFIETYKNSKWEPFQIEKDKYMIFVDRNSFFFDILGFKASSDFLKKYNLINMKLKTINSKTLFGSELSDIIRERYQDEIFWNLSKLYAEDFLDEEFWNKKLIKSDNLELMNYDLKLKKDAYNFFENDVYYKDLCINQYNCLPQGSGSMHLLAMQANAYSLKQYIELALKETNNIENIRFIYWFDF